MRQQPGETRKHEGIPLWMRKSTVVTVVGLSAFGFLLVAYYLLPVWWAEVVVVWVRKTNAWVTGAGVGFFLVLVGLVSLRGASLLAQRDNKRQDRSSLGGIARICFGVIAGLCFAAIVLTVLIGTGITQPLAKAQELWHPYTWLFVAMVMGSALAVIGFLLAHLWLWRPKGPQKHDSDRSDVTNP